MHAEPARRGNVEHLARAVGLSRSRFYEQFKRAPGVAPGVFADGVRLERAISALIGSRTAICQISDQLGFPEQSHFTRFFRSKVGFAPSAYRRVAVSAEQR
jgi:AraC-like DNA-binding protein